MRYNTINFIFLLFSINFYAQVNPNEVFVSGYYKSNGTYVEPHYRTSPNSSVNDNFSTIGNTNPHTGKAGWISRDNYPIYKAPSPSVNTLREPFYIPEYEGEIERQRKLAERKMFPNGCSYDYDLRTFNDSRYTQSENTLLRQFLSIIYKCKEENNLLDEIKFRDMFNEKKAQLDEYYKNNSEEIDLDNSFISESKIDTLSSIAVQNDVVSKHKLIDDKLVKIANNSSKEETHYGKILVLIVILYFSYKFLKTFK